MSERIFESLDEVFTIAERANIPAEIWHLKTAYKPQFGKMPDVLRRIEAARARGLDVTTEAYPYGWGMTLLNSALFNPGWRERMRIDYSDLRLVSTGETLSKESYDRLLRIMGDGRQYSNEELKKVPYEVGVDMSFVRKARKL